MSNEPKIDPRSPIWDERNGQEPMTAKGPAAGHASALEPIEALSGSAGEEPVVSDSIEKRAQFLAELATDNTATCSQNRILLRGDPEANQVLIECVDVNVRKQMLRLARECVEEERQRAEKAEGERDALVERVAGLDKENAMWREQAFKLQARAEKAEALLTEALAALEPFAAMVPSLNRVFPDSADSDRAIASIDPNDGAVRFGDFRAAAALIVKMEKMKWSTPDTARLDEAVKHLHRWRDTDAPLDFGQAENTALGLVLAALAEAQRARDTLKTALEEEIGHEMWQYPDGTWHVDPPA
jgi:tetratricopeptide (TPR) repeat protein